jgi:5-formyltetrahydrofolate cyclo-ligase
MPDAERRHRSTLLWRRVLDGLGSADRIGPGHTVMAFFGFGDEPVTDQLHEGVWQAGGSLLLPRVEGSIIAAVPHRPDGPLETAVLGVLEPTGRSVDPATIDTVIVPAVAFDREGHRLGYGAGFYDRFLTSLAPGCMVLGACLAPQLVDHLPADEHDVTVPTVVTDEAVVSPEQSP